MWLILNSLEIYPGKSIGFLYKPMLAAPQHEPDRLLSTEEAGPEFPAPHAEPERRGDHPVGCLFQGVDIPIIGTASA
jgi:hypothetical protein